MLKQYISSIANKQNELLIKATGLLWLFEKLIGWRVWTTYRLFPTAPLFEFLDAVPPQIHLTLFIVELLLIVLLIVLNSNRYILISLLLAEIMSCILDQNRLQPYEYQCLIITGIFLINRNKQNLIPATVAFILAATYFYSGVGKFNEGFLKSVWGNMILREFFKVSAQTTGVHWIYLSGYFLGLAELLAGVALCFLRTQKMAALFLILMHLFILILIGPFGLNYNKIVWPWNVAMIIYLYIVFLNKKEGIGICNSIFFGWNKLVFILLGILPALNSVGHWDNSLSMNLYSGKAPKMVIGIRDTTNCMELKKFFTKNKLYYYHANATINVQAWALTEMNTLPYPELRVYKELANKLRKKYPRANLTPFYFVNNRGAANN